VTSLKEFFRRALYWLASSQATCILSTVTPWLSACTEKTQVNLSEVSRILVVRLDQIGDVVMTTPLLRELRRNVPQARITLVVKPGTYNLAETCPHVDEVLTFDWKVGRFGPLRLHGRALRLAWTCLWERKLDLAILPRWDVNRYHGAYVTHFSGASHRIGYSERVNEEKAEENEGQDRLFTHLLDSRSPMHEVERNLEVLESIGGTIRDDQLELWTTSDDERFAEKLFGSDESSDKLRVVMCPGAGSPKRRWPLDRFVELGRWIQSNYGATIVVIGGPDERKLGRNLEEKLEGNTENIVGVATLRQTAAIMHRCDLHIGNDTGPTHMAAAVGLPVIEISCHPRCGDPLHSNSPERFGPWVKNAITLQPSSPKGTCKRGCTSNKRHCILNVGVKRVKKKVQRLSDSDEK